MIFQSKRRNKLFSLKLKLLLILVFVVGSYIAYCLYAELPTTAPKLADLKSLTQDTASPDWPDYGSGAAGAVGFDGVLTQYGDQSAHPIASITKVITALVVLEAKPLEGGEDGPSMIMTQDDLQIYYEEAAAGAAVQPVKVGGLMTERQALETMLLPSAANYSVTLAIWAYGSVDAYLIAANSWLKSHNLNSTTIVDASGMSDENVSTPSDLIEIGKLALANPALASIVSLKQATIPGVGTISNSNRLLGSSGINGIKTGTTSAAGVCLLFSSAATVGTKQVKIVGVILGGDDRNQENADVIKLVESMGSGFREVKLASRGQQFASYKTAWGQATELVSNQEVKTVVWGNTPISVTVQADSVGLVRSGENKGTLVINVGGKTTKYPLVISNSTTDPGAWWRLTHFRFDSKVFNGLFRNNSK